MMRRGRKHANGISVSETVISKMANPNLFCLIDNGKQSRTTTTMLI